MAHFARIENNNIVSQVIVVDNEIEHRGQEFLAIDLGLGGRWVQTSYNSNFRNKYAAIGDIYNENSDVFYPQQPYPSWTLDQTTWSWVSPIPYPEGDTFYDWNEESQSWVEAIE
jgi:hypothetical protein